MHHCFFLEQAALAGNDELLASFLHQHPELTLPDNVAKLLEGELDLVLLEGGVGDHQPLTSFLEALVDDLQPLQHVADFVVAQEADHDVPLLVVRVVEILLAKRAETIGNPLLLDVWVSLDLDWLIGLVGS